MVIGKEIWQIYLYFCIFCLCIYLYTVEVYQLSSSKKFLKLAEKILKAHFFYNEFLILPAVAF